MIKTYVEKNKFLEAALEYSGKWVFSIIPCNKYKKPHVSWREYQSRRASVEEICAWWKKWPNANIGIVTGSISGICVIDIDTEQGAKEIEKYLPGTLFMPIAITSGGGKHLYFKAPIKNMRNNTRIIPGCDFRGEGGYIIAPPSKAISKKTNKFGAYIWQVNLTDAELPELPANYINYITNKHYTSGRQSLRNVDNFMDMFNNCKQNKEMANKDSEALSTNVHRCPHVSTGKMFTQGTRDNDLFHVANCLVKGGMAEQEILQVIEKLALSCSPPFPLKEAQAKVKSALDRADRKYSTLASEVREFVLSTNGHFMSTDVYKCLYLSTRQDKKNVSEILRRLVAEGVIEKFGEKNGCFRLIDKQCDLINWEDAPIESYPINLPLGLNSLVKIMPKNIIVLAGEPNSGKTALLLNIIAKNLKQHSGNIHCFSSEMADTELKMRLRGFEDIDKTTWKGCKFWERAHSFSDVIYPDGLNIIDYLELDDVFYKIGGMLREIHNKLNKGIAIIALQQNPGASMGRGGTFGLEKPRLYLSLNKDYPNGQVLKIVKAKNWSDSQNPNGLIKSFKILNGCKLIEAGEWKRS